MRKSLSIALALTVAAVNPVTLAYAAPAAPSPIVAADEASKLLTDVKNERRSQGRKPGGGGNRAGNRPHFNRPQVNRPQVNRPQANRPGSFRPQVSKPFAGKPQVRNRARINRNVNRRAYRGYARHQHHHWRWSGGRWIRPSDYWWIAGGAIAAGIAIGYLTYEEAAAWAYDPPGPGYCWYYTDPSREDGFWDVCPVQ